MAEVPEETPPPESGICGVTGASWWGGLLEVAKSKSASAMEFVKRDLTEFSHTMHADSEALACDVRCKLTQETATTATMKVKHGMSILLGGIKSALIIPPDEMVDNEAEAITISSSEHIFDRAKARLHAIQIDPGTYCNQPTGATEHFEEWLSTFELEGKKGDISELLVSHVEVRALYTQMVPTTVSHSDFWQRYFYKMHQLQQEDQRRADLMKRVNIKDDTDLAWDDEDDWENMDSSSPSKKTPPVITGEKVTPDGQDEADKQQTTTSIPDCESVTPTDNISSPTNTISSGVSSTTTECSSKDLNKDLSVDTLTIVSAESTSLASPEDIETTPQPDTAVCEDQQKADSLKTKEKGDLVVVGTTNSSEGTSPSSSDSHSHNKESLDEDWEKDFDIEVTEEEVRQAQLGSSNETKPKEGDEDWESWE